MIPKIRKILYATDLSQNSAYAFRYAVNSATHHDAGIHILHVLEIRTLPLGMPPDEDIKVSEGMSFLQKVMEYQTKQLTQAREEIQRRLREFCRRELQGDEALLRRVASIEVVEGDPAAQILIKADELEADIVIMGSHGKGALAQTFLGSTAQKVLQLIKIPVYIIPIPKKTDIAF